MHSHDSSSQLHVCLICGTPLEPIIQLSSLVRQMRICPPCQKSFHRVDYHGNINGYPLWILYDYNDFFRSLLYRYKGLYDYMLKDVFLDRDMDLLKKRYHDYYIAIAPSDMQTNQIRGFAPNEAIVKNISSHVFNGLYKNKPHKQSSLRYDERACVKEVIDIRGGEFLRGAKVLLFDDVITSSQTIQRCLSLIEKYEPACIEILVLSTRTYL